MTLIGVNQTREKNSGDEFFGISFGGLILPKCKSRRRALCVPLAEVLFDSQWSAVEFSISDPKQTREEIIENLCHASESAVALNGSSKKPPSFERKSPSRRSSLRHNLQHSSPPFIKTSRAAFPRSSPPCSAAALPLNRATRESRRFSVPSPKCRHATDLKKRQITWRGVVQTMAERARIAQPHRHARRVTSGTKMRRRRQQVAHEIQMSSVRILAGDSVCCRYCCGAAIRSRSRSTGEQLKRDGTSLQLFV